MCRQTSCPSDGCSADHLWLLLPSRGHLRSNFNRNIRFLPDIAPSQCVLISCVHHTAVLQVRHGLVEWWMPFRLSLKHAKESQGHTCPWFHQANPTLTFWHIEATADYRYFADIFEWIFLKENRCIVIKVSLKCFLRLQLTVIQYWCK